MLCEQVRELNLDMDPGSSILSTTHLLASYLSCGSFYNMQIKRLSCSVWGFSQRENPHKHVTVPGIQKTLRPNSATFSGQVLSPVFSVLTQPLPALKSDSGTLSGLARHMSSRKRPLGQPFQFFFCMKQDDRVNHPFLLHLSFPPFPSIVIKQGHVCNMPGILPKV